MSPTGAGNLVALPTSITQGGKQVLVNSQWAALVGWIAHTFNVQVSSGYRDPQHNAEVGGASGSDHLTGNAVDFVGPGAAALYKWATVAGRFPYVEPQAQAKDHVHISFARGGQTTDARAVVGGAAGAGLGAGAGAAQGAQAAGATSCLLPVLTILVSVVDLVFWLAIGMPT